MIEAPANHIVRHPIQSMVSEDRGNEGVQSPDQVGISAVAPNGPVKLEIEGSGVEIRTTFPLLHGRDDSIQISGHLRGPTRTAEFHRLSLQDDANTVDLLGLLFSERINKHSPARVIHHEPLLLQLHERFANRDTTDAALPRQFAFVEALSCTVLATDNAVA